MHRVCQTGLILLLLAMCIPYTTPAQNREQLWLEFQTSYPFSNRYLLENTVTYQTVLSGQDKWRSISISPAFQYSPFRRLDLLSEIPIGYTKQAAGISTFEVNPMVGFRFHITQGRRIDARVLWRYQLRAFREIEQNEWTLRSRTRFRTEAFICLNKPNLFNDNLWYILMDYEEFIIIDEQLDERYANRRRARIGLAYRLNYKHRFQIGITRQSSRNEIQGSFISNDNIIQLRYRMFFNPVQQPASIE